MKLCKDCNLTFPEENFYSKHNNCKSCNNKKRLIHKRNNPDKTKAALRKGWYKRKYGLSLEEREELLKSTNYSCAICNRHFDTFERGLHIDHNHETGKVRSVLCPSCNLGLGSFKDDASLLKVAASYLEKYEVGNEQQRVL